MLSNAIRPQTVSIHNFKDFDSVHMRVYLVRWCMCGWCLFALRQKNAFGLCQGVSTWQRMSVQDVAFHCCLTRREKTTAALSIGCGKHCSDAHFEACSVRTVSLPFPSVSDRVLTHLQRRKMCIHGGYRGNRLHTTEFVIFFAGGA